MYRKKRKHENWRATNLKLGLIIIAIALIIQGVKELISYLGDT